MANELLAHLAQHPSWGELTKLAKKKKDATFLLMAKDLDRGVPINDVDVAFTRGFFRGMEFLLKNPGVEDGKLERELADERKEVTPLG